jgi:hypothetical protein
MGRFTFLVCDNYYVYWGVCRSEEGYVEIVV